MTCKRCGQEVNQGDKFCNNCGEPQQVIEAVIIEEEDSEKSNETKINTTETLEEVKVLGKEFFEYIIGVIKRPVRKKDNLRGTLVQNKVLIFLPLMILINSIIIALQSKIFQNTIGRFGRGMGMFGVPDIIGSVYGFRIWDIVLNSFIVTTVFFLILGIIVVLTYNITIKKDINFVDTLRMALNTTIVLAASNIIVWALGVISIKLMFVGMLITMILFTIMIVLQLFVYLGVASKIIYTIPAVYAVALYLAMNISIKIM